MDELKTRALRLLASREHSRAELARKLAPHAASPEAVERLLDDLAARRLLSDARFAETRAHQLSRKYGATRVRQDLKGKGVADDIVERLAADSSQDELERARQILVRKYRSPSGTREEHAKRARFLQSRGFSYDTIRRALGASSEDTI